MIRFRWIAVAYVIAELLFTPGIGLIQTHSIGAQQIPANPGYPTVVPTISGSAVSGAVLKASPGYLLRINAQCSAACWLMIFNATAVPANGSTTAGAASGNMQECFQIQSSATASGTTGLPVTFIPPEPFSIGITAAISSTACATLTLATTGFINAIVQ